MKLTVTLFSFLILCLFLGSCNKGPTNGVPFYLAMDTAIVHAPASVSASSNSQKILDVWVDEGPTNIGAYELPCNFPVLDKGEVYFVVNPGVWQSGQSTNPVVYPFMNPDTFTVNAISGNKYAHNPVFTYKSAAKVLFNEDFENSMDFNSHMTKTNDSVRYGYYCGRITVSPTDSSVVACQAAASGGIGGASSCPYTLTTGQEIWLEMDYKSDVPFWSGIIAHYSTGTTDTIQMLFLLPTTQWNKEYIKLSETIGNEGASTYNLYFQALNPSGYGGGSVYLDNLRIIHM